MKSVLLITCLFTFQLILNSCQKTGFVEPVSNLPGFEPRTISETEPLDIDLKGDEVFEKDYYFCGKNFEPGMTINKQSHFTYVPGYDTVTPKEGFKDFEIQILLSDSPTCASINDKKTIQIRVLHKNKSPDLSPIEDQNLSEGMHLQLDLKKYSSDFDGDSIQFYLTNLEKKIHPASASIISSKLNWDITKDYNQEGYYVVYVYGEDDGIPLSEVSVVQKIDIKVENTNRAPILLTKNLTFKEGVPAQLTISAEDLDKDDFVIELSNAATFFPGLKNNSQLTFDPIKNSATISWTPNFDESATLKPISLRNLDLNITDSGYKGINANINPPLEYEGQISTAVSNPLRTLDKVVIQIENTNRAPLPIQIGTTCGDSNSNPLFTNKNTHSFYDKVYSLAQSINNQCSLKPAVDPDSDPTLVTIFNNLSSIGINDAPLCDNIILKNNSTVIEYKAPLKNSACYLAVIAKDILPSNYNLTPGSLNSIPTLIKVLGTNNAPYFSNTPSNLRTFEFKEGFAESMPVLARDIDNDTLSYSCYVCSKTVSCAIKDFSTCKPCSNNTLLGVDFVTSSVDSGRIFQIKPPSQNAGIKKNVCLSVIEKEYVNGIPPTQNYHSTVSKLSNFSYKVWDFPAFERNLQSPSQLSSPNGMEKDSRNYIYVANRGKGEVIRFTPDGVTDTTYKLSGFSNIQGIFVGQTQLGEVLYVADQKPTTIQFNVYKLNSTVSISQISVPFGPGSTQLGLIYDLTVDNSNNIYVSDGDKNRIIKIDSTGVIESWIGLRKDPSPLSSDLGFTKSSYAFAGNDDGFLNSPTGVALDSTGNIYVSELGNGRIQKFSSDGKAVGWIGTNHVSQFSMSNGVTPTFGVFDQVLDLDIVGNKILSIDSGKKIFRVIDLNSINSTLPQSFTRANMTAPRSGTMDSSGTVYITEANQVSRFVLKSGSYEYSDFLGCSSSISGEWGTGTSISGAENVCLNDVKSVAVKEDYIFVSDYVNNKVKVFSKDSGAFLKAFDVPRPKDLKLDSQGNIFVISHRPSTAETSPDSLVIMIADNFSDLTYTPLINKPLVTTYPSGNIIQNIFSEDITVKEIANGQWEIYVADLPNNQPFYHNRIVKFHFESNGINKLSDTGWIGGRINTTLNSVWASLSDATNRALAAPSNFAGGFWAPKGLTIYNDQKLGELLLVSEPANRRFQAFNLATGSFVYQSQIGRGIYYMDMESRGPSTDTDLMYANLTDINFQPSDRSGLNPLEGNSYQIAVLNKDSTGKFLKGVINNEATISSMLEPSFNAFFGVLYNKTTNDQEKTFEKIRGIIVDQNKNLYILDRTHNRLGKFSTEEFIQLRQCNKHKEDGTCL